MNNQEIEYLYCYHLPQYRTIGTRIVNNNIITELKLYRVEIDMSKHIITVYWSSIIELALDCFTCMFIIKFFTSWCQWPCQCGSILSVLHFSKRFLFLGDPLRYYEFLISGLTCLFRYDFFKIFDRPLSGLSWRIFSMWFILKGRFQRTVYEEVVSYQSD